MLNASSEYVKDVVILRFNFAYRYQTLDQFSRNFFAKDHLVFIFKVVDVADLLTMFITES